MPMLLARTICINANEGPIELRKIFPKILVSKKNFLQIFHLASDIGKIQKTFVLASWNITKVKLQSFPDAAQLNHEAIFSVAAYARIHWAKGLNDT